MPNYKKLYFQLFNNVTDTINKLKEAQQEAENTYINENTCKSSNSEKLLADKNLQTNSQDIYLSKTN